LFLNQEDTVSQLSARTLVCRDCGKKFAFAAGEQEFYESRGFSEPTRCPECRAARKATRESGYGGREGFGGRESYAGPRRGGRGGEPRGQRQMHRVLCADCGVETEVPFEPRSGRPVYCRGCFEKRSGRR
jgi:CxxC-x17-CxxC domain-containing protein